MENSLDLDDYLSPQHDNNFQPTLSENIFLSSLCSQNIDNFEKKHKGSEELDEENIRTSFEWLNRNLSQNGLIPLSLDLDFLEDVFSSGSEDQKKLIQSTYETTSDLLQNHIRATNEKQENIDAFNRLKNDKETLIEIKEKLESRVKVLKQDLGYSESREKALIQQHKKDKLAWERERDEMRKQMIVVQNREKQYIHELKKKDLLYEKLKEKVNDNQKLSSKPAPKVLNPIQKATVTGKTPIVSKPAAKTILLSKTAKPTEKKIILSSSEKRNSSSPCEKESTTPSPSTKRDPFKLAWQQEQHRSHLLYEENNALRNTLKLLQEEFHNLLLDANLSDDRVSEEVFDLPKSLLNEVLEQTHFNMKETAQYLKEHPVKFIDQRANQMGLDQLEDTVSQMKRQFAENENEENL